jgi:hypothetical protein
MSEKLTTRWKAGRIAPVLAKLGASKALRVALGVTSTIAVGGGAAMGCLDRPIATNSPRTTSTVVDILTQSSVDKIDVLLVIDNSGSMGDKQAILATAVPKLVSRLVKPVCVGALTGPEGNADQQVEQLPEGGCPDDFEPEFKPINDINIGIVSSSLGAAGSAVCSPDSATNPDNQDLGRLLSRRTPGTDTDLATTYQNLGFLAWDPEQARPCPGEGPTGEACPGSNNADDLIATLATMVQGVGEVGCGFEAPLEAAYRFLADPAPSATIPSDGETVDEVLLEQRASFLRPDSLLAVILLTDENDCSFREDSIGEFGARGQPQAMPLPREECANDPDDPCCKSCIDDPGECPGNGGCAAPGDALNSDNYYPDGAPENTIELRCWDQKRRFGYDFLYPTDRYVNAFSQLRLDPGALDLAVGADGSGGEPNPIFTDLQDLGRTIRPPDLVFVASIAGVPWQLIARKNADGEPDLNGGLNSALNDNVAYGGFQSFDELEQNGVWADLIPDSAVDLPNSPYMIETPDPRPDLSAEPGDAINGNEYTTGYKDLQYACIFDLPEDAQRTCDPETDDGCADCNPGVSVTGKPLCDPDNELRQFKAKAYPGTRLFEVLYGLRNQGIPASICPAQLDPERQDAKDFGYTPAVFAIIDRLKTKLGGSCQPRQLVPDTEGNTPCIVIEARDSDGDKNPETSKECAAKCKEPGRAPIDPERTQAAATKIEQDLDNEEPSPGYDCLCEIVQLQGSPDDEGSDRYQCQNDESVSKEIDGWCYVDATTVPPTGNRDLVSGCPATEQRLVRFVNRGEVSQGGRVYITCAGDAAGEDDESNDPPAEE